MTLRKKKPGDPAWSPISLSPESFHYRHLFASEKPGLLRLECRLVTLGNRIPGLEVRATTVGEKSLSRAAFCGESAEVWYETT